MIISDRQPFPRLALWTLCALLSAASTARAADTDWPAFHGGGALTGAGSTLTADANASMRIRWTYRTNQDEPVGVLNSAAIVGERVFVADQKGTLHAIDLATGKPVWTYKAQDGFESAPLVKDGRVFIGDVGGTIHCVSAEDGATIWTIDAGAPVHASANLAGDAIVLANDAADIICINPASGEIRWKQQAGDRINSAPAVAEAIYVAGCDAQLRSYSIANGEPLAAIELPAIAPGSPAIVDQRIIVGCDAGKLVCYDTKLSTNLWTFDGFDDKAMIYSSPSIADGLVVVGSRDRTLRAIDLADGRLRWTFRTRGDVDSSPAIADGRVYVGSNDKKFYVLDLKSGREIWSFTAGRAISASPAIGHGVIVISDETGSVFCFEPEASLPVPPSGPSEK